MLSEIFKTKSEIFRVDKDWGRERWLVNNERYCAKILDVSCNRQSSLHYHKVKDETFFVLFGSCYIQIDGETVLMQEGDSVRLKPESVHRFYCINSMANGCKILEISTTHSEEDVYRLELSGECKYN